MSKSRKTSQQIKDEQINYLLGDVEKSLEEYRKNSQTQKKYRYLQKRVTIKHIERESLKQRFSEETNPIFRKTEELLPGKKNNPQKI